MIFGFFSLLAFIPFHFGILGLHFLSFWSFGAFFFGPSFPFILAFWAFISFHFGPSFPFILAFLAFPCILAFWVFISLHFGLLGLHFLSFWPFGPSSPFILAFLAPFLALQVANFGKGKIAKFKGKIQIWCQILAGWALGLLGLHFLSFWSFGPSFPFILAFLAPFWPCRWQILEKEKLQNLKGKLQFFYFDLLGAHFLSFWPFGAFTFLRTLTAPGLESCLGFWPFGPSFLPVCRFDPSVPNNSKYKNSVTLT